MNSPGWRGSGHVSDTTSNPAAFVFLAGSDNSSRASILSSLQGLRTYRISRARAIIGPTSAKALRPMGPRA